MLILNAVFHLLHMPQNNEWQVEQNLQKVMSLNFYGPTFKFFHKVTNLL